MVMLSNPEAPATSRQLWLLHILTKTDTRGLKLTMQQASERIDTLKSGSKPARTTINRPLTVTQDKQATYNRTNPGPERVVTQGKRPGGLTDMVKIQADFDLNGKPLAIAKLQVENIPTDNVRIDFYDFNCKDCLFGQTGICMPAWSEAGYMTCAGKVENVNFKCDNYEPTEQSNSEYCHRPHGKQCHRKAITNPCLECNYRKAGYVNNHANHTAWYRYIPTIQDRLNEYNNIIKTRSNPGDVFSNIDFTESINRAKTIIGLLNKLEAV